MKYLVTLIETTSHVVEVEASSDMRAKAEAHYGWMQGNLLDDRPRLENLEVVQLDIIPEEDVA
jgi:hypothetical protein